MLTRFVDHSIEGLSDRQVALFKQLLAEQDPLLNEWLMEQKQPQDEGMSEIVRFIQKANNL